MPSQKTLKQSFGRADRPSQWAFCPGDGLMLLLHGENKLMELENFEFYAHMKHVVRLECYKEDFSIRLCDARNKRNTTGTQTAAQLRELEASLSYLEPLPPLVVTEMKSKTQTSCVWRLGDEDASNPHLLPDYPKCTR